MKKKKRHNFTAPLVIDGIDIADLRCGANLRRDKASGEWRVDSWVIYGQEWYNDDYIEKKIHLNASHETDPVKECLRSCIEQQWNDAAKSMFCFFDALEKKKGE